MSRKILVAGLLIAFTTAGCMHNSQPKVRPLESMQDKVALEAGELRIAESALRGGDIQVARSLYGELSQSKPNEPAVWLGLGDTYFLEGEFEPAKQAYLRAEELNPAQVEATLSLARVAIRLREFDEAKLRLQSILAHSPNHPTALSGLGVVYDLTGQPELAQQTYRRGLKAQPGNEALRSNLGLSLAINGHAREAVNVLLGYSGVSDKLPQARDNLALAYGLLGREDAAEDILLSTQSRGQAQDNLEFYRYLREQLSRSGKVKR